MRAMILAAGRGERMGELTRLQPKPLLSVAGKPLLLWHIEHLAKAGFRDLVINASYRMEQIQAFVNQLDIAGLNIQVVTEAVRLETGGGIFNALSLLGDGPFLVLNADVWIDYPLDRLPSKISGEAHLVLVPNPAHNPEGDFYLNGSEIVSQAESALTFSGLSLLTPALFKSCAGGAFPLAPLLRQAITRHQVTGECYQGCWVDVGTPARLQYLEALLREPLP